MKKIERFILREILSDGPAGTVYKADEVLPGDNRRAVALKVLPGVRGSGTGESAEEVRFFGEVKVLAQLAVHPHIVTIYGMGLTEGYPWLAMEYSPATLQGKITDNPGEPAEVLRVLEQVAKGLAAMHGLKPALIHQDLKPANVLIDVLGQYKITDFSLATVTAAHKTHGLATVRYAAPELLSSEFGRVGPATDLYALGHIAYELALGNRVVRQQFPQVFEGNTSKEPAPNKWMMWHASINMKPNAIGAVLSDFPPMLSEVVARLMAKQLGERYGSAEELLSDLAVARQEVSGDRRSAERRMPGPPALPVSAAAPARAAAPAVAATDPGSSGSAPAMDGQRFYVRLRGKVTGPYDLATLQRQLKQGAISRLHQVSADQQTWKQASEIEGLYGTAVV